MGRLEIVVGAETWVDDPAPPELDDGAFQLIGMAFAALCANHLLINENVKK